MRKPTFVFFTIIFFALQLQAQNYYISSSYSGAGTGTLLSPWNSFAPLNALLTTIGPIDTVFLKRGDIFRDQITIAMTSNFVITAYGSGNMPIISGADTVQTWTNAGTYWQANFTQPVLNFFANDQEQILARYPDDGAPYLTVDAGSTNNTLNDAGLGIISTTILNESQVCVHTAQWCWEKSAISSSTSNSITYLSPTGIVPTANYGYFLYDHLSYLTAGMEWKYDSTAQQVYYQPMSGDPNTLLCEATVRSYGILMSAGVKNVTISNVAFEKQSESGIGIIHTNNNHIVIDNCSFARQYKYGVEAYGKYATISNSSFRGVDGIAVYLNGSSVSSQVHHNTFNSNGGFRNSGIGAQINLTSIMGTFVDSCHIHHNNIDSAGYCGISMDGKANIIERNIIKNVMLLVNDGGALKSFGTGSQYNIFRNNFISTSDGNTDGIPMGNVFVTPAMYFDNNVNYCTYQDNTVYGRTKKGIFLNSGSNNNTIIGNVIHGGNCGLDFNGGMTFPTPMTGMTVKNNVFFAKDSSGYILRMVDNTGGYNQGMVDSNYYFQPYNASKYVLKAPFTNWTFAQWQDSTGFDMHTRSSFVNWTLPTSYDSLFMNQTDSVLTIDLGTNEFLDLDSNIVCGTFTLQPYTSRILINNLTTCSASINELANENGWLVYPNPFNVSTTLQMNKTLTEATLTVYNLSGQMVKQINNISGQLITLYRDNLSSGIYFVRLIQNNKVIATNKLIITD